MARSLLPLAWLAGLLAAVPASAQVLVDPPNFAVDLVAAGLSASGERMAVDRFGNVYVLDQGPSFGTSGKIVQVRADGAVDAGHSSGFGRVGQLAYHPLDGHVYLVASNPILPVILSNIWRLEPGGGATQVFSVDVVAEGFTIDDDGLYYFGGGGTQANGLHSAKPPATGAGIAQATFLGPGFGANSTLQALATGHVLIADGDRVERYVPGAAATLPYYDHPGPFPNDFSAVVGLGRGPMNQLGLGAMVGVRNFGTFCFCGTGFAISAGPTGDLFGTSSATFAHEDYNSPEQGLRTIASGVRQELYWYTHSGPILPGGPLTSRLFRVRQVPGVGSQGSLFVKATATSAQFDAYGPVAGGDPFTLGLRLANPAVPPVFLPPFGILDLFPGAGYIALVDGLGVVGPPNPFGVIPAGGLFSVAFPVPPGLSGTEFLAQHVILANEAPNGLFFIGSLASFQIP